MVSLGGEQPRFLEIMAHVGREAVKHVPEVFTSKESQGFILEPTINRQTQVNLTNGGLMSKSNIYNGNKSKSDNKNKSKREVMKREVN